MTQMFSSAKSFDQDIDAWNVANVTDMGRLFGSAISFDQTLAGWDVSSVTNWNNLFNNARGLSDCHKFLIAHAWLNSSTSFESTSYANWDTTMAGACALQPPSSPPSPPPPPPPPSPPLPPRTTT